MPSSVIGIAPSRGCAFTGRRAAKCGRTSSTSSRGRCSRSPARRFRTSPAASAPSIPTATSKSPGRSTRYRWRCSGSGSVCGGTRTSCASSRATRSSWCMPGWPRACLRPVPARRRRRRASKRTSIDWWASVRASARRSSSGPPPRSRRAASAPFGSFKASSA